MLQQFKPIFRVLSKISKCSRSASTFGEQNVSDHKKGHAIQPIQLLNNVDTSRFQAYLPQILQDIGSLPGVENMKDTTEWLNETIQTIVTFGDFNTAHQTVLAYKYLSEDQKDLDLAIVNGWIFELGIRGFEIMEDMMDGTRVKNGRPTWHCNNNHGLAAVSDSILVMSSTAMISEKYFKSKSYYSDMITLRTFNTHFLLYGKSLALKSAKERQFHLYNMDFYSRVKTLMHSRTFFYGPVTSCMLMTGLNDPKLLKKVEEITNLLGVVHSAKTDLVGVAYHPEKFEQSIANGMCTWQFAMALEHAPREDRKILLGNYGLNGAENQEKVKIVYEKMEPTKLYPIWEEERSQEISKLVAKLPIEGLQKYFDHVFKAFFGRSF